MPKNSSRKAYFLMLVVLKEVDYVGWLSFLLRLHKWEGAYQSLELRNDRTQSGSPASQKRIRPTIAKWPRSWDFMPMDVVKPLASSTLGAILVLSARLRMEWSDLQPAEGVLRA